VDPEIIHRLRANLRGVVVRHGSSALASALREQRGWVDELLLECNHPGQRRDLHEIAAQLSALLAYVATRRGEYALARAYCGEVFQLGELAEDCHLQAWARGLQSFCEYGAGNYAEALRLAIDGLTQLRSGPRGRPASLALPRGPWPGSGVLIFAIALATTRRAQLS